MLKKISKMAGFVTAVATLTLIVATGFPAQAQQGTSLADAARQARAQKQAQQQSTSQAQQLADALAEDQSEGSAPGGFKTYNTGDYKIWVPAPYRLEGHDDAGVVLAGPPIGSKHSIVLLGTPFVAKFEGNDIAFQDAATQFSHLYAQSASCSKATVASHTAYECGLAAGSLLGQHITGNAVFVKSLGRIYPVFCLAPSDSGSRDFMNDTHNAWIKSWGVKGLQKDEEDIKSVMQKCETVFQSIRIPEGISAQKAVVGSNSKDGSNAATSSGQPEAGDARAANAAGPGSLADIARGMKQPGHAPAADVSSPSPIGEAQDTVPAGFKVQAFVYCKTASQCWNASVLIPSSAQLVSSDCKQYIFETKVQGASFLLLAGMAGADSCAGHGKGDTSQVRWDELAQPESARAPGTYNLISSQQAALDGKPAVISQIGFRKGTTSWMGKRAELDSNGVPLVVGCMAPREHFADGDSICTGLIGSLRLP